MQETILLWISENPLLFFGLLFGIGAVFGIVVTIIRALAANSKANESEIHLGDDFINGKGFVGNVTSNLLMGDNVPFMTFSLPYGQITSVGTEENYLVLFVGNTKYSIKHANPELIASEVKFKIKSTQTAS